MKLSTLIGCTLVLGCSSVNGAGIKAKKKVKHLKVIDENVYQTPCINLPFIDRYYPERLGEVIRLHNPKVDPVGAYKISRMILKNEDKEKSHVIDTSSVRLCRLGDEMGYLFKAIKVTK